MNWDDLRYVLAVSRAGSLVGAARTLGVEHTTAGRRIASLEAALGVTLFTRNATGYVRTAAAERLLAPLLRVEEAVLELERAATSADALAGPLRVTSPETFGAAWLAPRLARFCRANPGVQLELNPSGAVLDLGRREAEVAVRMFRSTQAGLVARRAGRVAWGLYGSHDYLRRTPVSGPDRLHEHALLGAPGAADLESRWLKRLDSRARPRFTSPLSLSLLAAARASAGLAMLPRYLGDAEPGLRRVELPDPPHEDVWLTVHRDLRNTPRVRALLDFLADELARDPSLDPAGKST